VPHSDAVVAGKRIAITGRLATLTRREAQRAITEAGAVYAPAVTPDTDVLVIGHDGWPLRANGKLTRALRTARDLAARGARIAILPEPDLLAMLGLTAHRDALLRSFTAPQLCRMLGIAPAQMRAWIRAGLITPHATPGGARFDFQQVAGARALLRLVRSGAGARRIARSLRQVQRWLPAASSLTHLCASDDGDPLLVQLGDGRRAEANGQLRLFFGAGAAAAPARIASLARLARLEAAAPAGDWVEQGLAAECEGRLADAEEAYARALRIGGPQAEVAFNLGNVLYAQRRTGEAVQRYLQAVELQASFAAAWNNLGNALADLGRHAAAIDAYRRALDSHAGWADAHWNLAETLHALGRRAEAIPHWRAYLAADASSEWARHARARLRAAGDAEARES
jgi:hypothetical protein